MELSILPVTAADRAWIVSLLTERWGSTHIDTRERLLDAAALPGFVARRGETPVGLLTWHRNRDAFEVVTLDAVKQGVGIGALLLRTAMEFARAEGCARLWLTASNDNFRAQRFYQRHGLRLTAVHADAITRARLRKPEIPLESHDGIPLRDEWEYEIQLGSKADSPPVSLAEKFGDDPGPLDIYLFDQILKGRFENRRTILEVGCGGGRNLATFLRAGHEVHGIDRNPEAVAHLRDRAARLSPGFPPDNFQVAEATALPYADSRFDAVLCIALLHFAEDESRFMGMVHELWRVLRPGGLFFARLASSIGLPGLGPPISGRRHRLPDGSDRFLVDEAMLLDITANLGGVLLDPLKTTNVQGLRCMTTWVMEKRGRD